MAESRTDPRQAPDFGPLAGLKVVYAGQALAGPFAANLMAEMGADVLWVENPQEPDVARSAARWVFEMERRNQRTIALNVPTPTGTDVLLRLLSDADVFIESSKNNQYRRWGLGDDQLWSVNPKLVIVHVSGYGLDGDPDHVKRAAFDPIAQAFGCYLQHNGPPDGPPAPATPYPADYLTGLFACSSALAAVRRAEHTGEGESIDVAMYEVLMRVGGAAPMAFLNEGVRPVRKSTREAHGAGTGLITCQDGVDVYVILRGAGVLRRALPLLGLEYGTPLFPAGTTWVPLHTAAGDLLDQRVLDYCETHPASKVESVFNSSGIPCSRIFTYEAALDNPHYAAREVFTGWTDWTGQPVRGVNIFPKFARRPCRVWSGSPAIGRDTADVLQDLGFSGADIQALHESGVIRLNAPT